MLRVSVLLCLPLVLAKEAYVDEDGYLTTSVRAGISVAGAPWVITSHGYPRAGPRLMQDWEFMVTAPGGATPALRLDCQDLRMPETRSCRDYSFSILDGKITNMKETRVCGNHPGYSYTSKTNEVAVLITAEKPGELYVNCSAKAVVLDKYGNEMGAANLPTAPPRPSSGEDSSEHGVTPGRKTTSCRCGWANKNIEGRIVGGRETKVNEFPFIALVVEREGTEPFCGGTVISEYHVLTAAHCTNSKVLSNTPLAVVLGLHDRINWSASKGTELINVEKSVVHERFNHDRLAYDISLMYLERRIVFSAYVGPACLPSRKLNLEGQTVITMGWGGLVHQGYMSQELRKASIKVLPLDTCAEYSTKVHLRDPHQMCIFAPTKGFCMGDSGGPIVWLDPETNRYTLVGAPSFVKICGSAVVPSVATDVSQFLPWIERNMKETNRLARSCSKL